MVLEGSYSLKDPKKENSMGQAQKIIQILKNQVSSEHNLMKEICLKLFFLGSFINDVAAFGWTGSQGFCDGFWHSRNE